MSSIIKVRDEFKSKISKTYIGLVNAFVLPIFLIHKFYYVTQLDEMPCLDIKCELPFKYFRLIFKWPVIKKNTFIRMYNR